MGNDEERRFAEGRPLLSPKILANVAASVGVILAILAALGLVWRLGAIFMLVGVSAFLAVVLNPLVEAVARRFHLRRSLAVLTVYGVGFLAGLLLASAFVTPLYSNARRFAREAPGIVGSSQSGNGPVASAARRLHLQSWVSGNADRVPDTLKRAGGPALKAASRAAGGLAALALVAVLTFMVLVEAPRWIERALSPLDAGRAERARRVGRAVSDSVTGYVLGTLLTSLVAGTVMAVTLLLLGVPFWLVFAVWVAIVDLLPQVGGLLAALPTLAFAALHRPSAGIIVLAVFVVYQQVENHLLTPAVMSRTVDLSPLWVLLSFLAGAQLAGLLGALFAVPVAATLQILGRELLNPASGSERTADNRSQNGGREMVKVGV
jgi:predicted PurR-regulated permease PerM